MCGIVGIIGKDNYEEKLSSMLEAQHHRGPDNTGVYFDNGYCALGHNRLSIIDLSELANQPFKDSSGRYILVFNGEIYNYIEIKEELKNSYKFSTSSDTEVLLAAYIHWGKKCLDRLNGMFSFAIWDSERKKIFAARDRFGVKPFYYSYYNNTLIFASEIKAIKAYGLEVEFNESVWANYLMYGNYGMPNETFYKEVNQLPGGHYLEIENTEIKISQWYDFVSRVNRIKVANNLDIVKSNYVALLKDSISLRFRSDVKVGFNVSGGVDSSTLLAFVNEFNEKDKIQAFTFYTGDDRYDEVLWVEEMINKTQSPLKKVLLKPEEVFKLAGKISKYQDEPYGGIPTLAYSKIFQEARKQKIIVLLDGQGMDEQWAGYDYYLKNNSQDTIQGVTKSPFKSNCLSEKLRELSCKPQYPKPFNDEVKNMQYRDLFYTKIPRALRFNDRVSMTFSTELREPFLDYRLVEYAFAQPSEYKIKNNQTKFLLRDIVSKYLGDSISYAPKRPLQTPQREWLGKELKNIVESSIEKITSSEYASWFEKDVMKKEWNAYLAGDNDSSFYLWQWISLAMLIE